MRQVQYSGCIAAVLIGLTAPAAAQDVCATPQQAEAFAIRDLQSRLLVGALGCGQRAAYNAFIKRHESALARAGQNLVGYFKATGRGSQGVDSHVTRAANTAALHHAENRDQYCARSATLFSELMSGAGVSLRDVAHQATFDTVRKPRSCQSEEFSHAVRKRALNAE